MNIGLNSEDYTEIFKILDDNVEFEMPKIYTTNGM